MTSRAWRGPWRGDGLVFFAAVAISVSTILAKFGFDAGSNPLTVQTLRFAAFVVCAFAWFRLTGRSLRLPPRQLAIAYGVGVAYFAASGGLLGSIAFIPISLAVLIFYTFPLLIVVYTSILDRRWPAPMEAVAFLVAFVGIGLALEVSLAALAPAGLALACLAALGLSTAYTCIGRAMPEADTMVVTCHMALSGLVLCAGLTFAMGAFAWPAGGAAGWVAIAAAAAAFVAAFFGMFAGLRLIGPVRTGMVMNVEPVATIAMSVALLGERLSVQQMIGAALVIGAILMAQVRSARTTAT